MHPGPAPLLLSGRTHGVTRASRSLNPVGVLLASLQPFSRWVPIALGINKGQTVGPRPCMRAYFCCTSSHCTSSHSISCSAFLPVASFHFLKNTLF